MYWCPHCGAKLPELARFCAQCGGPIAQVETPPQFETAAVEEGVAVEEAGVTGSPAVAVATATVAPPGQARADELPVPENIAAVISYLTLIPAVVFLYLDPFRRNRFVRFHAIQHLLLFAAAFAVAITASLVWTVLELIPFMRVLVFPFVGLIWLAWFFLWLLLVVKAYHHEVFKLPWIGDYAEEWSE